ncbi:hypothetical protein TNCV_127621 [Trichonephila clavipes]|nr:hypothetical protein TNCV_127621 [Trichonephila clavipes]
MGCVSKRMKVAIDCQSRAKENTLFLAYRDEDIGLNERDCDESEESSHVIDNTPVNPDIYVTRDSTESIPCNSIVPGRLVTLETVSAKQWGRGSRVV